MKVSGMLIFLGIIIIVAGGIYLYTQQNKAPQITIPQNNSPVPNSTGVVNSSSSFNYDVVMSGFAFSPATTTIHVGDSVTWTNMDSVSHTVTSDTGSELSSSPLTNRATYSHTFNTAGTYTYHCSIHTTMKGTIIVQ
jgi:plastocyanin